MLSTKNRKINLKHFEKQNKTKKILFITKSKIEPPAKYSIIIHNTEPFRFFFLKKKEIIQKEIYEYSNLQ